MSSGERSPKRQRLSPPAEQASSIPRLGPGDSAYGSTTTSQVSEPASNATEAMATIPGLGGLSPTQAGTVENRAESVVKSEEVPQKAELNEVGGEATQSDTDHRRTDHERQEPSSISLTSGLPFLCKKTYTRSRPHPSQDLISLYKLGPFAATVARRDPTTGAKINKLRKSYEGKIKSQNLPGRNKPTTLENELMGLMEWPAEGWYDQRVYGRELEVALDPVKGRLWRRDDNDADVEGSAIKGRVERALTLNVGRLPKEEDDKWRGILALDEPAAGTPGAAAAGKGAVASKLGVNGVPAANGLLRPGVAGGGGGGTGMRSSAPASPANGTLQNGQRLGADRPDRAGKKRRYDDASFEGYDGGWVEDDGYSTGGDGRGTMGRKKRREFDGPSPATGSSSSQLDQGGKSYGHFASSSGGSMVGVRSS